MPPFPVKRCFHWNPRKPILVLFIKEKALHFWNYSHFWMFSVIVRQRYWQSNIYDKVLSAWYVNEKPVVSFGLGRNYFPSLEWQLVCKRALLAGASCSTSVGWVLRVHVDSKWRLTLWMGCPTGLSISEWSSLVPHCAVNIKCML